MTKHDPAGNLVFDGNRYFTYDAQNRLIQVRASFREASVNSGDFITDGPILAEYRYDAMNRRVEEKLYVGGVLDTVNHHYYLGWSVIETRNGSDQVVTQHVWDNLAPGSGHYIDRLTRRESYTFQLDRRRVPHNCSVGLLCAAC